MSSNVKIIAFANDHNEPMLINFINSLKKYGYDYSIIGKDVKWENFMTKIKGYLNYVKSLYSNQLIAIVDAYDVIATGPSDEFISRYKSYGKSLVVGSEIYCGPACIPVDNWWKDKEKTKLQYANSGFFVGPVWHIIEVLEFMLSLNITDDQIAMCNYINTYPEKVALDIKTKLVANILPLDFHYLNFQNERIYHKYTDEYPLFVHTPGKYTDLMIRSNYVGSHVLEKDYQYTPLAYITNEIVKKIPNAVKNHKTIVGIVLLLLLIVIILGYYNPKLLIVFFILLITVLILFLGCYIQRLF
jgi:hypothetical protein